MSIEESVRYSPCVHTRDIFYVGGEYVKDNEGNTSLRGQMYVEKLVPHDRTSKHCPIIFIHGATRSGTDWLTKPDGSPGWAVYFLSQGFECYLVDLPFRGRSPCHPEVDSLTTIGAEATQTMFTACREHGPWPQAELHTQWPGTGMMGDAIFDQFFASGLQMISDVVRQETASQAACAALLDRIGQPAILLGHSSGGPIPYLTADIRPDLVKAIVALEPAGPPFSKVGLKNGGKAMPGHPYGISNAPITYDPPITDPKVDFAAKKTVKADSPTTELDCLLQADHPPPRQLINLVDIPCLVVTAQASYHAQYDWGNVAYLKQSGIKSAEHLKLAEIGIFGNGHMMFMERNSDQIAGAIVKWIRAAEGTAEAEN